MRTRGAEISTQISDDEAETEWAECPQCEHQGWMGTYCPRSARIREWFHSLPGPRNRVKETGGSWTSRLARGLRQLTRSKKAGNELPPVGQRCLARSWPARNHNHADKGPSTGSVLGLEWAASFKDESSELINAVGGRAGGRQR
jgi:hypothetical protein